MVRSTLVYQNGESVNPSIRRVPWNMVAPRVALLAAMWLRPLRAPPRLRHISMLAPDAAAAIAADAAERRTKPLMMPPRLSPTAVSNFKECPQLFLFRNMWKLPEPPSKVLAKGILVHLALEKVFELPPERRRTELHDVLRGVWSAERKEPRNAVLFESRADEREWGLQCLHLLDNYLLEEDPAALPSGEPLVTEAWLSAELAPASSDVPALKVVGKVDRLVRVDGGLVIVDYKTGKAPSARKYTPAVRER